MKTLVCVFFPFLYGLAAPPAEIDALIEATQSVAPEFASDALIRIAATGQVDKARKLELLALAFERAAGAEQPYKRRAAISLPDSQAGHWNRVYGQDLDGLSLRLRSVAAMLPIDSRKARESFLRIPPLQLSRVSCEEFLVYDAGRFYEVLGDVLRQGFSETEVREGQPSRMLDHFAGSITSPVQVAPMARIIAAAELKDGEFQRGVSSFAGALGKVAGDDRSFTYSYSAGKEIEALVGEAKRRKVSPLPLIESYRLYLVKNLSAARCADDDLVQGGQLSFGVFAGEAADQQARDFVGFFNARLRMSPLAPIAEQEATPSRLEGVALGLRFCQDAECRGIADRYRKLVLNENGTPYPPGERNTAEWQSKLRVFLEALDQWKPAEGTPAAEYFEAKCRAYAELLNLTASPNRELAVRALLNFAAPNQLQKTNRLEWFLPLNGLIGRLSLDPLGFGKLAGEMFAARNPVISLYTALETAAPRTPEQVLALL